MPKWRKGVHKYLQSRPFPYSPSLSFGFLPDSSDVQKSIGLCWGRRLTRAAVRSLCLSLTFAQIAIVCLCCWRSAYGTADLTCTLAHRERRLPSPYRRRRSIHTASLLGFDTIRMAENAETSPARSPLRSGSRTSRNNHASMACTGCKTAKKKVPSIRSPAALNSSTWTQSDQTQTLTCFSCLVRSATALWQLSEKQSNLCLRCEPFS
jgi:hypothetical protein